jgi:branched-chain amino acid transport system substrate-binding protein
VASFKDLTSDGINLIMVGPYTAQALAIIPLLDQANALGMVLGTIGMGLTHDQFNSHFFRHGNNAYIAYGTLAQVMAKKYPDITKWAIIIPDGVAGEDIANSLIAGFKRYYPQLAGKQPTIFDPIRVKIGAPDYRSQLAALMSYDAEGISSSVFGGDGITFWQQAKSFGLDKKYKVQLETGLGTSIGKALQKNTPSNLWVTLAWFPAVSTDNPVSNALRDEAIKRTNDPNPGYSICWGFDPVLAIADAIKKANTIETNAVIKALTEVRTQGAGGIVRYRAEDHQMIQDMLVLNYGPDEKVAEGWRVYDHVFVPGDSVAEPPAPGQKWSWS